MKAHAFHPDELAEWSGGSWSSRPSAAITGFCQDSRQLKPGEIYVAIRGERHDGHAFINEALAQGAAGAIADRDHFQSGQAAGGPLLSVENTRLALLDIAAAWRSRLPGSVGGVTGSAGKTTVKELTADILSSIGPTARTRGNWNNDIGLPLSLLAMTREARYGVFEAGINHIGEMKQLCAVLQPQWAIITTVGIAHLEYFGTVERIAEEKAVLAASVPGSGFVVLSADEPWYEFFRSRIRARVVSVSLAPGADADYTASRRGETVRFADRKGEQGGECEMPLPGEYFIRNALLSAAAAAQLGADLNTAAEQIGRFKPLGLRGNRICAAGVTIINDAYNANPLSMSAALQSLSGEACSGRKWAVLGDMGELGPTGPGEHRRIGEYLAKSGIERLVTVGPLAEYIGRGAVQSGFARENQVSCAGLEEAAIALRDAQAGDIVLLKASRTVRLENLIELFNKDRSL